MKRIAAQLAFKVGLLFTMGTAYAGPNQTDALSPINSPSALPFKVQIEKANFELPMGIHSGVAGVYKGQWVFIAGRVNGMHGFGPDPFPPSLQNRSIYVVDLATGKTTSRPLNDPSSGLTQEQIDSLSVTSPEGYQDGMTLYMVGGYVFDTVTATYVTKPTLTAIYLPGIIDWVTQPGNKSLSVAANIRQLNNPVFQITGGELFKLGNTMQLVFGQNFSGVYNPGSNGVYSQQIRQFQIHSAGGQLSISNLTAMPANPDPNYRRRDLNVLPALLTKNNLLQYGLVAYSGVFTLAGGIWTVPVVIDQNGSPSMADPNAPSSFKQAMNQYICASVGLYSRKNESNYHILFGGISYGFFANGVFQTDTEDPFINQVTTISMDKNGNFAQFIMDGEYPVINSTTVNPGNPLLFGAGAYFIPENVPIYPNGILNLDNIQKPTVIGYIVGGIASTLANTNTLADSFGSPYVFKVTLTPNH